MREGTSTLKSETEIRADRETCIYIHGGREIERERERKRQRTVEARATERSGGNVSYAQHVIFGDPSEHFFAWGTFAHPSRVCVRAFE